ncbi:MAG: transposase [Oscillospiraceae bacterium]|nr:transposase [Oscillospiraceae bacterium]
MNTNFEFITNLQYKVKSLNARVAAFESGDKYTKMRAEFETRLVEKEREIRRLKNELADSNARYVSMRENWWQVYDDMDKAHAKELEKKEQALTKMEKRALNAERQLDETKDRLLEKTREIYKVLTELEDEKGKNLKLKAQITRDHENSSKPSSMNPNRKKITNNREPSGKSPGAQPGHDWHPRKKHVPTNVIMIPAPQIFTDNPDYKPTGRIITKQLVDICIDLVVNEYSTPEYRNIRTGVRVHADFPGDLDLDVTYGGTVKAFAFLLNNYCNVSIDKVSDFLCELTNGELSISTGLINGLSREFSQKTEAEQRRAFADILLSPVMNIDFTTANVNGKNVSVTVCATPENVLYFAREHKGHEGLKGTPAEDYQNIFVHDHDITFYSYGGAHQECNDHALRYLKGSMENEVNLKWNRRMRDLIREMIHFRKHLDPDDKRDPDKIDPNRVRNLEERYDEILKLAQEEYEFEPPGKYYKDGYNLYLRMGKYKAAHLLFLHDRRVPYSNSLAERLLRIYKRKQHQVMAFRSFLSLDGLCCALGVIATLRAEGKSLFQSVAEIFDIPVKSEALTTALLPKI